MTNGLPDENLDELFSYNPDVRLKGDNINDAPITPENKNLHIPKVELDRKAAGAMVKGIFSLFFFVLFPIAICAIVSGAKSINAPNSGGKAKAGIVMGIISLLLFIGTCTAAVLFYDKLVSWGIIGIITDLYNELLTKTGEFFK